MPEWIVPWITTAVVIWPLLQVERWVHRHIQGLGLLLTNDPPAAVLIYYLTLLPGVILHEGSQWLLAKALRVKVKKFQLWPDKQGKVIRLGLVEIDKKTDNVRATLVGMVPLAAGVAAIESWAEFVPANLAVFAARRDAAVAAFAAEGFACEVPKATMYLWIPLPEGIASADFSDRLREEQGVIVMPGSGFGAGGEGFFRVSFIQGPERIAEAARRAGIVRRAMLQERGGA